MRAQRPARTLLLMLAAAGLMLAGGVWLARRTVEVRRPVDRTLLRETAALLQNELSRLDTVLTGHLRRAAQLSEAGAPLSEIRDVCANLRGPEFFAILPRKNGKPSSIAVPSPGSVPPVPELVEAQQHPSSPFAFPIPADEIFGPAPAQEKPAKAGESANLRPNPPTPSAPNPPAPATTNTTANIPASTPNPAPLAPPPEEGWTGRPGDNWLAWWHRPGSERVAVFLIRGKTVEQAVSSQLQNILATAWAPVRAAGGLDCLEAAAPRRLLAGVSAGPGRPADFIVPLSSRLGNWQIASWDRRGWRTEFNIPTLAIAGTLAIGIALLGWKVAADQRAALREVTARVSFVNRVSHELSAPLTNLQLSLDLARDSLDTGQPGETGRRLGIAQEETARLGRMVANVLTFARRDRSQPENLRPETCRPAELVRRVLDQFSPALTRRGITVTTELDDSLEATLDPDAFSRITANLLSNVEKYAASGKRAVLTLTTTSTNFQLTVRDFGPGIPSGQTDRIFLPFERLDSRITEGVTGTGLGLAIARELATRMGGHVHHLSPEPDHSGATFQLTFPLKPSLTNNNHSPLRTSHSQRTTSQ